MGFYGKLEGVQETLRALDKAPENMQKLVKKASAAAGRKCAGTIKQSLTEPRWKNLVRSTTKKYRSGKILTTFGLIDRKEVSGHQPLAGGDPVFDWSKAYWINYGTLKGRDPNHNFKTPIKKRNKGTGIIARRFFEAASDGILDVFEREFTKYIDKNIDKI